MEETLQCDRCGEKAVTTDVITGIVVCESCGCVKEDSAFTAAWDAATGEGFGNFVSATDTGARASRLYSTRRNGRWVHSAGEYDYHERKQAIALKKLMEFTSLLRLPAERVNEVKYMVEKLTQGQWGAGRWFEILIGACIYVIVRQSHLPLTIIEVAVIINCNVSELGRMYNRVLKFLDIKLPDVDLFIFLERVITSFSLFSIVAAILAFIAEVNEVNVGLEDISKELNVPMHTCKLRYKEIQESLVRVGQSLPWGKDITTKTVVRHAFFLLQYMEIKANAKSRGKESISKDKECPKRARIGTDKTVSLSFEVKLSPIRPCTTSKDLAIEKHSMLSLEKAQYGMHVDMTGNPQMDEQHSRPCLRTGDTNDTSMFKDTFESKLSAKSLASIYGQFLQELPLTREKVLTNEDNIKRRQQNIMVQSQGCEHNTLVKYPGRSTLPQEKISMQQLLNTQEDSDALPPSFVASVEARARRCDKINAAKLRINEVKKSISKYLCWKDNAGQSYEEQIKDKLRQTSALSLLSKKRKRKNEKSGIDWEDYIIECLLLHEADENQIEDGHYSALLDLHVFKSDEVISDDDLQQYFRSKGEVALMSMLQKDGNAYPWISMAGL
ncbi:plant-specific TFIIB-related protein PTF2 isoform X2 [Cryptomeria japonica]|uniref:plant-specific TFIIB-related protein PTF2 isoform X2 n=1 Tax=Cryptomeria japonica TaxID=3369 RepID=UPI0027DA568E|nr:plant-specific TFIIB-related protein PTF2 isoform X2 [Cryptomeria japonica]